MSDIYNEIDSLSYGNYETKYNPMSTDSTKKPHKFKTYPIMKFCSCKDASIITTNDGNKRQKCTKCGAEWRASDEKIKTTTKIRNYQI